MSIEHLMTKTLVTLDIDDDLARAKQVFEQHQIHHILILNGKELAGLLTDRDLFKNLSPTIGTSKETPKDTSLTKKKLHLVMSRELVTAGTGITINEAVLLFYDNHISCLPIVDDNFRPLGILTWRDVIKIIAVQYRHKLAQPNKPVTS
ncbi:hypothetical protein tinsulaeT_26910 [Thalassotalea insulae]|uniref:CBS domain-containing protein n=1 Tax=Thalassotalea insulae TaxID=2056778 RepID=A0ABQ6GXI5_9GAMM|nr:CBS domain-containing protein [Thalassotalea insulae]GLX79351.1 hypothetical protein tinsulaeT_26910 [Thalassotalea insulae]